MLPGDTVNFWRVEAVELPGHLLLRAEMRLPGTAWLEYRIEPVPGGARLTQIAWFHARGLPGKLYWYLVAPLHAYVFHGLLTGIGRASVIMEQGITPSQAAPGKG